MQTLEVRLPMGADLMRVETVVEWTCQSRGLTMKVKTSLVSYEGSTHWHFRKGTEKGTLEVTFWKREMRLWLSVHDNRIGGWTTEEMRRLKLALEAQLASSDARPAALNQKSERQ
jgi:hypothetical protein